MADQSDPRPLPVPPWLIVVGLAVVAALVLWPGPVTRALVFAVMGLVHVAPLIIPGILLAGWIIASGADTHIAKVFEARPGRAILAAALIGAITPVCGVTVLPLMAGLLAAGVPLAPIMAFWLSSPVTDPAMLAATAATLGLSFAVGKTVAAFGLGLFGGAVTTLFADRGWARAALRDNRLVGQMTSPCCGAPQPFMARIWQSADRRAKFRAQCWATTRLVVICLLPAFAAEYALNATLSPEALTHYVGTDVWYAIPLAVLVGSPAYIDGYASLPLTRGLMDVGMSNGAAMAFLVSGGVVSIWGAMAIFPVLKIKPFLLYLALAVVGSMVAGYVFEVLMR